MNAWWIGAWVVWCAVGGVVAADEVKPVGPAEKTWKGTMKNDFGWGQEESTFYTRGSSFRVETKMGSRTKTKVYDGKDYYEFWDGGKGAYRAGGVRESAVWKIARWRSVATTQGYRPTEVDREEPFQGKPCRYQEFLMANRKEPVKEWIGLEAGIVLKREIPMGDKLITMDVTGVSEVSGDVQGLFVPPKDAALKKNIKGRAFLDELIGQSVAPFRMKVAGKNASLDWASFKGKPVVLNFFATWCGPCRQETPDMVEVCKAYKDKGVEFISIDIGEKMQKDPEELVAEYVKQYGVPWPIVMDDEYYHLQYASAGVPTTFIVDAQGIIRAYNLGGARKTWFDKELKEVLP